MLNTFFTVKEDALYLYVKIIPGASRNKILDKKCGRLRISIASIPEDGKANAELITYLSKIVSCPKSGIKLVTGEKSRQKTLRLPVEALDKINRIFS
jgi:uncharacterized protein (TIGR00251 family)